MGDTVTVRKPAKFTAKNFTGTISRQDATEGSVSVTGTASPTNLADVYLINQPHSLAFHRNALALVTRPLALPMGASKAAIVSHGGLGIRVVFGYDQDTKKDTVSLDIIYGIKTLDADMAVKLVG